MSPSELKKLEEKISKAASLYYVGSPLMTDSEFDSLTDQLPEDHPLRTTPGWGGSELVELLSDKDKVEVKHKIYVGGLPKKKWEGEEATVYEITHKLDGLTGVVYYDEDGKLENIVTRGDGHTGIRVDADLNVPKTFRPNAMVRVEIVIEGTQWNLLKELDRVGGYKHPRNAASGIVMSKDRHLDDYLTAIAYQWINSPYPTQTESLQALTPDFLCLTPVYNHDPSEYDNESHLLEESLPWKEVLPQCYVVVDGSVWSQVRTGEAKAFKYENLEVEATVTSVEWIESDRGRLHPTVHIEPIELDGATIRKASGKSGKFIIESKINTGATILIRRANNVIPDIVGVIVPSDVESFPEVDFYWEGANMRSSNGRTLTEQLWDVSRQMILAKCKKGIAEKSIIQFVDIYDDIQNCKMNTKEKSGKTFKSIEQGLAVAQETKWSYYELLKFCKIDGVGEKAITSHIEGTSTDRIASLINGSSLFAHALAIYTPEIDYPKGHNDNEGKRKVCITGTLDGFTKKTFADKYNLQLVDVKDAEVVIASDLNSAKAKKAEKLDKIIMTQNQFMDSL